MNAEKTHSYELGRVGEKTAQGSHRKPVSWMGLASDPVNARSNDHMLQCAEDRLTHV